MVHFSNNVNGTIKNQVCTIMGMKECTHNVKYLGHSFCKLSSKRAEFHRLLDKTSSKLVGWKKRSLSMVGRTTLIKSVLQSLPSFIMQTFLIPRSLTVKIDKLMKDFFGGFDADDHHRLHLHSWKNICRPKELGGLGIRRIQDVNRALLTKLNWLLCTAPNKIWVQLIRSRYLRGRRNLDFQHTHQSSSWIWGGITHCGDILARGACYQVSRNSRCNLRLESWIPSMPTFILPAELDFPPELQLVRDLMNSDGRS